jgi:hypothetical protein
MGIVNCAANSLEEKNFLKEHIFILFPTQNKFRKLNIFLLFCKLEFICVSATLLSPSFCVSGTLALSYKIVNE